MAGILPWIVVALVVFVILRMVISAIKTSAKLAMWLVIAIALGAGFLWYQQNKQGGTESPGLPTLSIPGSLSGDR